MPLEGCFDIFWAQYEWLLHGYRARGKQTSLLQVFFIAVRQSTRPVLRIFVKKTIVLLVRNDELLQYILSNSLVPATAQIAGQGNGMVSSSLMRQVSCV